MIECVLMSVISAFLMNAFMYKMYAGTLSKALNPLTNLLQCFSHKNNQRRERGREGGREREGEERERFLLVPSVAVQ